MYPYTEVFNENQAMPDIAEFVTPGDAARDLGFNINSIYRMIDSGKLEAIRVGKKQWLISKESLGKYKQEIAGKNKHDPRRNK